MFRTIVVGNGLIGSAAARHLTQTSDGIVLLGPDEPDDRAHHTGVFASHYDEGRMTRIVDPNPAWSITAKRSIERYRQLETDTGVEFFSPSGYLGYGGPDAQYLQDSESVGRVNNADVARYTTAELRETFSYLRVADGIVGIFEAGSAGHISPRKMIQAQNVAASRHGAVIVKDEAVSIRVATARVEVATKGGVTLTADKVLLATGAFTNACGLLCESLELDVVARTVVFARMDDTLMDELAGMPTIGHAESGAYILPPIAYADGHHYLKIGIGTSGDRQLVTYRDLVDWFKGDGSESNQLDFRTFLSDLIPSLEACDEWHSAACAVTQTRTGLPYVDFAVDDRVAVAVGGNGKGAKSSDDWGWLAARLMTDADWSHPVERELLRLPGRTVSGRAE